MRHFLILTLSLLFGLTVNAQTTKKKVAVILFNFENYPTQTTTPDAARGDVFTRVGLYQSGSVNAYYKEVSYGHLELTGSIRPDGDVFGWYTIPNSTVPYSQQDYSGTLAWPCGSVGANVAETMAAAEGFVRTDYDAVVHVFPFSICGYNGISYGGDVYINYFNGIPTSLLAHELGHTFGLQHAHALSCVDSNGVGVPISNTCFEYNQGYGDFFDVMVAGGAYHMNSFEKESQNTGPWFDSLNLQTVTTSGDYVIAPFEPATNDVKYLKIRRDPNTNSYWYLEFRQNYGFDIWAADHPVLKGVLIHLAPDPFSFAGPASALIDTTPNSTPSGEYPFQDAALGVGKTFTDSQYGINVTTLSVSSAGAVVRINFDSTACKLSQPDLNVNPVSLQGKAGQPLVYQLALHNKDITACYASAYNVSINAPAKWSVTPNSFSEWLMPGEVVSRQFMVTPPAATKKGSYTISQKAVNSSRRAISSSSQTTVIIP